MTMLRCYVGSAFLTRSVQPDDRGCALQTYMVVQTKTIKKTANFIFVHLSTQSCEIQAWVET